jgi:hypothetical protein
MLGSLSSVYCIGGSVIFAPYDISVNDTGLMNIKSDSHIKHSVLHEPFMDETSYLLFEDPVHTAQ